MAHQSAERRLRCVIGGQPRACDQARDGRDENHGRTVGEPRQRLLAAQHRPAQVDGEHLVPIFRCRAFEAEPADADADIQHQPVEPAERLFGFRDHALDIARLRDVGLDGAGLAVFIRDLCHRLFRRCQVHVSHGNAGAFAREQQRHGAAVAHGVARGVEHALAAAHHEDAAARKPSPPRCAAFRFRRQRPDIALLFGHAVPMLLFISSSPLVGMSSSSISISKVSR